MSDPVENTKGQRRSVHRPRLLYRLFRVANWTLELCDDGAKIDGSLWRWEDIRVCEQIPGLNPCLKVEANSAKILRGARRSTRAKFIALQSIAPWISKAQQQIDLVLTRDAYVAEFDRKALLQELRGLSSWSSTRAVTEALKETPLLEWHYNRASDLIAGDRNEIDQRNSDFVERELQRWREWLEGIEAKPLSDEQARAVAVMEDRNLLIAAAGSGKTSTIVAKVAYAIGKEYVSNDQILVLVFNKRIQKEIASRISSALAASALPPTVDVATFHSFGFSQLRKLKSHMRLAPWSDSQARQIEHLSAIVRSLIKTDIRFAQALIIFSAVWLDSEEKERDEVLAATQTGDIDAAIDVLSRRDSNDDAIPTYMTLSNLTVRSLQELRICNWLSLMGVRYEYERPFDEAHLPEEWNSGYRPDFYYPDIDCWHEHFGLNKFGKAPAWMSREGSGRRSYEDEVVQKRAVLEDSGVQWFETTSADFYSEEWEKRIQENLVARGLTPEFIGWQEFAERYGAATVAMEIVSLSLTCIHHAKSNNISPDQTPDLVGKNKGPRAAAFLDVFVPIYRAYEAGLRERDELDFEDMVALAAQSYRSRALRHPYKLILVDEFQDMSNSRAELISAMLSQSPEIKLFGVGDDWQSIYRFAGADITTMTKFSDRFGFTASSYLTKTFRSNQFIADAASRFVMKNPQQIKKEVRAVTAGNRSAIEVVFYAADIAKVVERELEAIADPLRGSGKKKAVFLLGRYNFLKPESFERWKDRFNDALDISFYTVHRSKGLEADIVILLGASSKPKRDFPSTMQDDPLLALFMPTADAVPWAEERRLFYVALTRAKEKVCILAPEGAASVFVSELLASEAVKAGLISGERRFAVDNPLLHIRMRSCPECGQGVVLRRVSKYGPFEFCSNQCGYKRNCR